MAHGRSVSLLCRRSSKVALFGPFDPSSASWSYSNSHTGINAERSSGKARSMENLAAQMR